MKAGIQSRVRMKLPFLKSTANLIDEDDDDDEKAKIKNKKKIFSIKQKMKIKVYEKLKKKISQK